MIFTFSRSDMIDILIFIACIFAYLVVSYALPILIIQKKLRKHYREWIKMGAYWGRHYRKIIIKNKVFYTDEFTMDLFIAAICGSLGGGFGCKILLFNFDLADYVKDDIWIASMIASSIIIFVVTQIERFRIIDDELSIHKEMEGNDFNELKELEKKKRDCKEYILNK